MVKLSLFLNLLIISSVMSRNSKRGKPKKDYRGFVIGGNSTDIRFYPFQASQRTRSSNWHICGGSIISEKMVITAAHCIYLKNAREYYISLGSTTLSGKGYIYEIESTLCHVMYSPDTKLHDIGLIAVKNSIVYKDVVKPITIIFNKAPPGLILTLTGWGLIENNVDPDNLQMVQVEVISIRECKEKYFHRHDLTDAQVCTFVKNRKAGVCNGDSGGPLTYDGHLVGLVSWGTKACAAGYPDVHTSVGAYKIWINDNINNYCRKRSCPKNSLPKFMEYVKL